MATPMLPIELQELVIDSIHDEHHRLLAATLHSCCLTCRAWFPRSIRRLYRRLILSTPPRTQLDSLVELINTSPYVASAIEELVIGSVSRATKDSVGGVAIRAMLAGKLPRLRSMELVGSGSLVESSPPPLVVSSPLSRVPNLAGFPMLTTLRLSFVMFTSYVAFDRMLAAVPGLRRLSASYVICNYTRIPATFPDRRPRLPALSQVVWYENSTSEGHALSHLIRNVCGSLEQLTLSFPGMVVAPCIKRAVSLINDHPYFSRLSLPSLTTLRLYQVLDSTDIGAGGVMTGLIQAHVRLIAALLLSGTHARQLRRLELAYHCTDATSYPTLARSSTTPPESPFELALRKLGMGNLGRLLRALKASSTQFEDIFINSASSSNLKALETVLFEISDSGPLVDFLQEDLSQEERRGLIASIRSAIAGMFPRLHNHGLLSVKFSCPDDRGVRCDWMEDDRGNFERIPYRYNPTE